MLQALIAIFTGVLLPILAMVAFGATLQRFHKLDMPTLSRLNIYLFVPAFLFIYVLESDLTAGQMGGIIAGVVLPMVLVAGLAFAVMRAMRLPGSVIAAVMISGVVFNAGNYGIPVAKLRFGEAGAQVQAVVIMVANLAIWLLGYLILALGKGHGWRGVLGYFKLPMIYVLVLALALRACGWRRLPDELNWLSLALHWIADAVVPVSLVTLGAQMAMRARAPRWRIVAPVVLLKLVVLPATAFACVRWLGLWPWPGAQIVNAAAAPTAVNTLLLTLELDGDADTAADCVFWTTVISALTVTAWLYAVELAGGGPPGL